METIQCIKCGCVMGAASEVCPACGTPVIKQVEKRMTEETQQHPLEIETITTPKEEMAVFVGLVEELQNNLSFQRTKPSQMVDTYINFWDKNMNVREDLKEVFETECIPITNCVFSHYDGEEVFKGSLNDGQPHLMMQLIFTDFGEELDRFKQLDCYKLFHMEKDNSGLLYYSIDCGEDAQNAAEIFTAISVRVFDAPFNLIDSFITDKKGDSKKEAAKDARNNSYLHHKKPKFVALKSFRKAIKKTF